MTTGPSPKIYEVRDILRHVPAGTFREIAGSWTRRM